ncbi:hypothetical protein SS50377_27176 [Spironucleus salmonicida]|uniref:Uncharacterized protein n=1 Tax=Spironucleus salmonicida TaxID=348837 RepID=A0A9P8LMQ0_9EUKA|nr:hypothetical protein SS50377_27176 [Spironucleus salmonicida]
MGAVSSIITDVINIDKNINQIYNHSFEQNITLNNTTNTLKQGQQQKLISKPTLLEDLVSEMKIIDKIKITIIQSYDYSICSNDSGQFQTLDCQQ